MSINFNNLPGSQQGNQQDSPRGNRQDSPRGRPQASQQDSQQDSQLGSQQDSRRASQHNSRRGNQQDSPRDSPQVNLASSLLVSPQGNLQGSLPTCHALPTHIDPTSRILHAHHALRIQKTVVATLLAFARKATVVMQMLLVVVMDALYYLARLAMTAVRISMFASTQGSFAMLTT